MQTKRGQIRATSSHLRAHDLDAKERKCASAKRANTAKAIISRGIKSVSLTRVHMNEHLWSRLGSINFVHTRAAWTSSQTLVVSALSRSLKASLSMLTRCARHLFVVRGALLWAVASA